MIKNNWPAHYRIKKSRDFRVVQRWGKKHRAKMFLALFHPNVRNLENPRFGFVVSKKVGNAVIRNLCKRRLRELLRTKKEQLQKNWDVVIIVYRNFPESLLPEIEREIDRLFDRLNRTKMPSNKKIYSSQKSKKQEQK